MRMLGRGGGLLVLGLWCVGMGARAEVVTDAANDLLATFVPGDAASHADVDVTSTEVTLNKITNQLVFTATHVGNIGSSLNNAGAPGAVYVWGLDRGQGTERLAAIVNNVFFDSVVVLNADNTGFFLFHFHIIRAIITMSQFHIGAGHGKKCERGGELGVCTRSTGAGAHG